LILGTRYTTKDPSFHTWGTAPGPKFINAGENGGQWFSPIANLRDGSSPPAGSPQWMMNIGGGNRYALGEYHMENETWTTKVDGAVIDYGPDDNWMAGQFAGDRFLNIGWSTGGPPMMVEDYPLESSFSYTQPPEGAGGASSCMYTTSWEVLPGYTNIYNREPSPTNATHGTLKFVGLYDTVEECFAAVNASSGGPFHSFTYNDDTIAPPYGRHCWADSSFVWQDRGPQYKGQTSGRGPGFPIRPQVPGGFTHDHLTGLREVAYDPTIGTLVSNPVAELVNLRNGSLASIQAATVSPGDVYIVAGTGAPADASTSDVLVNITVPQAVGAIGVSVLANVSAGQPFGGILTVVNFTAPDINGTIQAIASIRTLNPCGSGSAGLSQASFPILSNEKTLTMRFLVDRSIVEVFVMGGRVVFTKAYNPAVLYVPDTNVAVHAWGVAATTSIDVFSMGCGWSNPPYQPNPTMESISPLSAQD